MEYKDKIKWIIDNFKIAPKEIALIVGATPKHIYLILKGGSRLAREKEAILIQKFSLPSDFFVNDEIKFSSIDIDDIFYTLFPSAKDTGITKEQIDEVIKVLGKRTK